MENQVSESKVSAYTPHSPLTPGEEGAEARNIRQAQIVIRSRPNSNFLDRFRGAPLHKQDPDAIYTWLQGLEMLRPCGSVASRAILRGIPEMPRTCWLLRLVNDQLCDPRRCLSLVVTSFRALSWSFGSRD